MTVAKRNLRLVNLWLKFLEISLANYGLMIAHRGWRCAGSAREGGCRAGLYWRRRFSTEYIHRQCIGLSRHRPGMGCPSAPRYIAHLERVLDDRCAGWVYDFLQLLFGDFAAFGGGSVASSTVVRDIEYFDLCAGCWAGCLDYPDSTLAQVFSRTSAADFRVRIATLSVRSQS